MYGALVCFDVTPTPDNAERIATVVGNAIKTVWSKIGGATAMAEIQEKANLYVKTSRKRSMSRGFDMNTQFPTITLSPWANYAIDSGPLISEDGLGLEIDIRVGRGVATETPEQPVMQETMRSLNVGPADPELTLADFRSEQHFRHYCEIREFFIHTEYDRMALARWERRHQLDKFDWEDIWLDGTLMYIFNISAIAYVISVVCDVFPVSKLELDRGQIDCS